MVLANASGLRDAFVTIDGVRYPVLRTQNERSIDAAAVPVQTSPQAPFPEPLILGDSSRSSDQRMASYALGDWRDGAGVFRYPAGQSSESLATFAASDCDTRFERSLVLRRAATPVGGTFVSIGQGSRVIRSAYPGVADPFHYAPGGANLWYYTGAAWTIAATSAGVSSGTISDCFALVQAGVATFAADGARGICFTTNGTTWVSTAAPGPVRALCRHDHKLWALAVSGNVATLYQSTDALTTPATMTWTAATGGLLRLNSNEYVCKLFAWRDRYGARAVYILTTRALYGYDADGQAVQEFADFTGREFTVNGADAYVWPRDDNLYVAVGAEGIYQFTGTAVDFIGPNVKGGLPLGHRASLFALAGNNRQLFAWGWTPLTDSSSVGGVWCLNQQGGWHRLYRDLAGGQMVSGGGYGGGTLWTALGNTRVLAQNEPDIADIPMNAAAASYVYETTTICPHYTAIMDGGLPNIPIQPLYLELRAIKSTDGRSQGLAPNTVVTVYYRTNLDAFWTPAGASLTSSSTLPARLPLNAGRGLLLSDIDLRLDLSSTNSANTPIITDVIMHFVRSAQVRSQYTLALDLRENNPAFQQDGTSLPGRYYTRTARDLKAALLAVAGLSATNNYRAQVVPVSYGGGPALGGTGAAPTGGSSSLVRLTAALVRVASSEDPLDGDGIFRVAIEDLSAPASGT